MPAGEALFVWVGGAAEPAKEGVRRAEALTIHQWSNRVVDHGHVTAPYNLPNSPRRDVDLIFHWGGFYGNFAGIIAQIRIVYVENFRQHAPSPVTASGNVQASRLNSYFSRKAGMYGQSGPQYPFLWCGMRGCCRAVEVCAGCEAETASVFFLHCAACERAMHPQRHNDATPSPLA